MMQGNDPVPLDGRYGPQTEAAIRRYRCDIDLAVDGKPTPSLLEHMQAG